MSQTASRPASVPRRALGATALLASAVLTGLPVAAPAATTLLTVSYDVSREFYKDYNALFAAHFANVPVLDGGVYDRIVGAARR